MENISTAASASNTASNTAFTTTAFERMIDRFCNGLGMSVGLVVLLAMTLISCGVIARELFGFSDNWITEVTSYLMGYVTFVGAGFLLWSGRHVRVEILESHLGKNGKTALFLITNVVVGMVGILLVYLSFNFWLEAWQSGEKSWGTFSIPLWMPYSIMLAGTVIFLFLHGARAFIDWQKLHSRQCKNNYIPAGIPHKN
ncbi:TRAP transporter small permease [Glaciimonas sp. Gout2]|uniref:TRAP transporter small permease subunit n=1 Tax=unclassified Glaciimonas TaxID=2644401 RepID=UPI002B23E762|nr:MULTISPECIES: TRAP transporter small permease [unclassified Glaciimonas]MEB0011994.1 TRAP transporter small permease [Glaciimonas sp. Cout2]MEB0082770.1 TRAP transporter small permease [Glaciimonas sp. Gout2]